MYKQTDKRKIEWVEIPAGRFIVGCKRPDLYSKPISEPFWAKIFPRYDPNWSKFSQRRLVYLPKFYISLLPLFEAQVSWYAQEQLDTLNSDGKYDDIDETIRRRLDIVFPNRPKYEEHRKSTILVGSLSGYTPIELIRDLGEYAPVWLLNYERAEALAAWHGARLPTLLEWIKAMRGHDDRLFPWGNSYRPPPLFTEGELCAYASPYGVWNMGMSSQECVTMNFDTLPQYAPPNYNYATVGALYNEGYSGYPMQEPMDRFFNYEKDDPRRNYWGKWHLRTRTVRLVKDRWNQTVWASVKLPEPTLRTRWRKGQ